MNRFRKYCPNVWVAECEEEYKKGEIIELETKYGKTVECEVYNLLLRKDGKYYYSIVKQEDQTYAERKAEKYGNAAAKNEARSLENFKASQEEREFLSLGEPIKIGHHSEKRHRALLERIWNRYEKSVEFSQKAEEQRRKAEYWQAKAKEITLAMPESLEYYQYELEKAENYHNNLKENPEKRTHSYSLTYAKKAVNELKKKVEIANELWGGCKKNADE